MNETKYFEDMWLALDNDLKEFNSYENDFSSFDYNSNNTQQNVSDHQSNLDVQTYEQLIDTQNSSEPSNQQLHSNNLQERIQAVKQYYSQNPGTFSWASLIKLKKVSDNLYKKGLVKQGNHIVKIVKQNT